MDPQRVWPATDDTDLWEAVKADIHSRYPNRFGDDHIMDAFTKACESFDDYTALERICKKTRMNCVWERKIIPEEMQQAIDES